MIRRGLGILMVFAILTWWGVRCVKRGNDFLNHYEAAQRAVQTQDLYVPGALSGLTYVYPPLYACLLAPMTVMNAKVAAAVWYVFKLALTALTFWLLWQWVGSTAPFSWKFAGLLFLATGRFIIDDFQLGQLTLVVMELAIIGLYAKAHWQEGWGAILLGMSIALKLLPGIFIVYFLLRKEFRFAVWTGLAAMAWSVMPVFWYGGQLPWLSERFWHQQVAGAATLSALSGADNQSLQGMLMRWLGRFPTEMMVLPYANIADLPFQTIKILVYVGDAVALGWWGWMVRRDRDGLVSLAGTFVTMLIISPNSGKSYFVALLLPYALMVHELLFGERTKEWRFTRIFFIASLILCTFSADGWIGRSASDIASSYSVMFWGLVVVATALHFKLRSAEQWNR